jgi:hypothetical protein
MPRTRMNKVFSVYHAMEERGVFEQNTANAGAVNNDGLSIYEGPVKYPMMLYHPKGESVCITQGIMIVNREGQPMVDEFGKPKYAGAVWGVKHQVVNSEQEEADLVGKGWHHTEAEALRANPETVHRAPPKTELELSKERIAELEKQIAAHKVGKAS